MKNDRGREVVHGRQLRGPRRARSSASPASPATARTSWSRRSPGSGARAAAGSARRRGRHRDGTARAPRARRLASCPPTATASGSCCPSRSTDNLVLTDYYAPPYARGLRPRRRAPSATRADEAIAQFDIRTPSADVHRRHAVRWQPAEGGRRARVRPRPALLVLDQPTRGLDVGSVEFIHRQTIAKRDAGTAVLLVSAELDEVLELSDRIARDVPRPARGDPGRPDRRPRGGRAADGDRRTRRGRRPRRPRQRALSRP